MVGRFSATIAFFFNFIDVAAFKFYFIRVFAGILSACVYILANLSERIPLMKKFDGRRVSSEMYYDGSHTIRFYYCVLFMCIHTYYVYNMCLVGSMILTRITLVPTLTYMTKILNTKFLAVENCNK